MNKIANLIRSNETKISVVGLGYVGLPIALEFAKKFSVVGLDISEPRIEMMRNKIDPSRELESKDFDGADIFFTSDPSELKKSKFIIITVPTPVDKNKQPDFTPLVSASTTVGQNLTKDSIVIYESTVYPGATEEICAPILESESGLKLGVDFKIGYSPERINPGDKEHSLTKVTKIVSGMDEETLENIAEIYEEIITAGVYRASNIKVAEAAKVIENVQRDLNIALMNELSIIFDKVGISTREVLEAAGTKWNFLKFSPGLVGGHCIGVDPYYLTYKAESLGYTPEIILAGRRLNDFMAKHVAVNTVKKLGHFHKVATESKVLVMGMTFKENVSDLRNSKVIDIVKELKDFGVDVDVTDAFTSRKEINEFYGLDSVDYTKTNKKYDAIILAVSHDPYTKLTTEDFASMTTENPIIIDVKGILNHKDLTENGFTVWGL